MARSAELRLEYEFPYYSDANISLAMKLARRLTGFQKPNALAPVRLVFMISAEAPGTGNLEVARDYLTRARADYHRFEKTFAKLANRAREISSKLHGT